MKYWEAVDSEINKQIDYVSKTVIQGVSSLEEYKFLCARCGCYLNDNFGNRPTFV